MKKLINNILHFSLIFLSFLVFGQKPSILRDSVCHNNNCYKLQELKLPAKDSNIYKKIQSTYNIFEGFFF